MASRVRCWDAHRQESILAVEDPFQSEKGASMILGSNVGERGRKCIYIKAHGSAPNFLQLYADQALT